MCIGENGEAGWKGKNWGTPDGRTEPTSGSHRKQQVTPAGGKTIPGLEGPTRHSILSHIPTANTLFFFFWKKKAAVVPFESFSTFKMWLLPLSPLIQAKDNLLSSLVGLAFATLRHKNGTECEGSGDLAECNITPYTGHSLALRTSQGCNSKEHSASQLITQSSSLCPIQIISWLETLVSLLYWKTSQRISTHNCKLLGVLRLFLKEKKIIFTLTAFWLRV